MNAVQTALQFSTASVAAAHWFSSVRHPLARGGSSLAFQFQFSGTTPITVSAFLHFRARHPQFSSLSTNDSPTAFQSLATSPFAVSFRHLRAVRLSSGTRHSDSGRRAFHSRSSHLIHSTSIPPQAPSDHRMGLCSTNPKPPKIDGAAT
jgi:hypothetical protein